MMKYPVARPTIPFGTEQRLLDCVRRNWFTTGPMVRQFEHLLAERLQVPDDYVVTTTSGTTALHLALAGLGIGPGDEVIVPDLTYVATVNAVRYVGATPVIVDVDPQTWCIDPRCVADSMTLRTKAIIPVHLYGQSCDMDALRVIAQGWCGSHAVPPRIIEDAAEGFGGTHRAQPLGTLGHIGCFSFFGNKLVTTGEGGACVTSTSGMAAKLRSLGSMCNDPARRYHHTGVGFNYRMTDLQAAVGIPQLENLDWSLLQRYRVFTRYRARLMRSVRLPAVPTTTVFAPWLFTCELPEYANRDKVMMRLAEDSIETRPTFVPMHEMFGAADWDDFPVTNRLSRQGISLPTFTALTDTDVDFICDALVDALEEQR